MAEPILSRWTTMRPFAVMGLVASLAVWPLLLLGGVAASAHEGAGLGVLGATLLIAGFMCTLIGLMLSVFALYTDDGRIKRLARLGLLAVTLDILIFLGVAVLLIAAAAGGQG